jgi:hypothetical protein
VIERVELQIEVLLAGRDARIAERADGWLHAAKRLRCLGRRPVPGT